MAIQQTVTIMCSPEDVYTALTSGREFGKATGAPAEIEAGVGGAFSCFGGQITGRQLELQRNRRIVQAWRASPWPEGVYSVVKIDIKKSGGSTTVELEHTGFPEDAAEHLEGGWRKMYWEPLKSFLE